MTSDQTYTLRDYLGAFRRRRGILMAIAVPIIVGATALGLFLPDQYRSISRINIDLEGTKVQTLEPIELTTYADQYIAKLKDRALARDGLRALVSDEDKYPVSDPDLPESVRLTQVLDSLSLPMVTQPVTSPNSGRQVDLISGFEVRSVADNPQFAYHVAHYVAQKFLEADRQSRTERASSTSRFLREQMSRTEQDIVELEEQVANFKVMNACCLPELSNLNMSVIQRVERDIEALEPRVRTMEKDRSFLQAQLDEIRAQTVSTDRLAELEREYLRLVANYGQDHPDVNRVRREIGAITSVGNANGQFSRHFEVKMRLAEAEQKYSDEHPDVIRYRKELAALEEQQGDSGQPAQLLENPRYLQIRSQINAIDTELAELRARAPELRQKIEDYEQRLRRTPQIESEYTALNRKLQAARDNFHNLQERLVIARQTEALESTEIGARLSEVRPATVPDSPSGPPRLAILIIGIFLAGTFGVGSMLFVELTDTSIRGSKDIAMVMNMVPLATIPIVHNSVRQAGRNRQLYFISGTATLIVAALVLLILNGIL